MKTVSDRKALTLSHISTLFKDLAGLDKFYAPKWTEAIENTLSAMSGKDLETFLWQLEMLQCKQRGLRT